MQHALEKDSKLFEQFGNLLEQSGVSLTGLHTDPEDNGDSDGVVVTVHLSGRIPKGFSFSGLGPKKIQSWVEILGKVLREICIPPI